MALGSDSALLIMQEIGRELRICEDTLALVGLFYIGKMTTSLTLSLYRGFKEHIFSKLCPSKELVATYGNWALVTGATEGVGRAFAEELARRGLNIVLLDSDIDSLNEVSAEIEQETGVDTRILEVAFRDDFEITADFEAFLRKIDVGILVNSYQVSMEPVRFEKLDPDFISDLLNANVRSLTLLTYAVLERMRERNKGLILNVSSFSGLYPVPFVSMYSASKAYLEFFSQALSSEYKETNIVVQTVTPGYIKPEEISDDRLLSVISTSKINFVRNTVDALGLSQRITGFWLFSLQIWIQKRIPEIFLQQLLIELMRPSSL